MHIALAIAFCIIGLVIVVYFAEKLVKGAVGTSLGFGLSTFVISVVFIGFDPENLAVGAVGGWEGASGIALGSIIGAAMVAVGLAFGLTALVAPMRFGQAPRAVLVVPVVAVGVFSVLAIDGRLSRLDGFVLLAWFAVSVLFLVWMSRKGLDIQPRGEVAETLEESEELSKWKAAGLLILSLAAIIGGSELLVHGVRSLIQHWNLSETVVGMTVLALAISAEELARELPAARKGRPEISYGNVVGSVLAFFLFNAGVIALIRPIVVDDRTLTFYLPLCAFLILVVSGFMLTRRVSRWAGAALVALYLVFLIGGYL